MRDRISQQIIDRRVEELLDPNLEWDSADREELLNPQSGSSSILSPLRVGQRILLKSQAGNYRITIMNATIAKAMEANAAEIGSTYEPDTVVEVCNDAIVVEKAGLKKVIPVSAIVEIRSMPDEDKKEPTERRPSQNVGTRETTSPDEFIKSLPPHALLFVTAEWSVACQRLKPTIENLKKRGLVTQTKNEATIHATIDQSTGQPLAIIEIDVTRRDSLQRTLGVKELPVLIAWHDGRETTRHEGYEDIAKVLLELQGSQSRG